MAVDPARRKNASTGAAEVRKAPPAELAQSPSASFPPGDPRTQIVLRAVTAAARMLAVPDWTRAIDDVLESLGRAVEVRRVFLFETQVESGIPSASLRNEWAAPGVEPQIDNPMFQRITGRRQFGLLGESLDAGQPLVLRTRDLGPPLQQWLEALGTSSVLIVPILVDGIRSGVIGFDDASDDRVWDDGDVASLSAAAGAIGAAIRHRRAVASMNSRDAILEAVTFAAEQFMVATSLVDVIDEVLARLGGAARASRVALIARSEVAGIGRMAIRAEWTAPGIKPLKASAEPGGFRYFPRWAEALSHGELIEGRVSDFPADERVHLEADGVQSLLLAPIVVFGTWWGHVGFDDAHPERVWSDPEIEAVRAAAGIIAAAIDRDRAQERLVAVQRMEAVGSLAGGLAHDFGNVLTAVIGNAELLRLRGLSGEAQDDTEAILEAASQGSLLIRDLMSFSRGRVGEVRPVDLNGLVRRLRRLLERIATSRVETDVQTAKPPPWVLADAAQLEQILVNLVVNARDAMPEGGSLTISTGRREHERLGFLRVRDTGIGMDEATKARIFEPLFTTKPEGRGTGFGLATASSVVAQLGGRIDVDTAPGEGTTFTILLPEAERPAGDAAG